MTIWSSQAQDLQYHTKPLVDEIKTIRTIVDDDFMKLPVLDMDGTSSLEISFDYLADNQEWLSYRVIHCDADWKQDNLSELDYLDGFLPVKIEDVTPSFNTFVSYYHYSISFPNEDVKLNLSGNYAVLIHPEDDPDDILAVATFSLCEKTAFVEGEVSGNTDIDFHKSHQQLALSISWAQSRLSFVDPTSELRVIVSQNRKEETRKEIKFPTRIESGKIVYEHNKDLIFNAGNNYRRFEFTDHRYASLGVDNIRYRAPYYYATLLTGRSRNDTHYLFDQDQNGRYLVHALNVDDVNTEAEYFMARFMLKAPLTLDSKGIYLSGDFTYGTFDDKFRMNYDEEENIFWKDVLLKQGAYNYQYLVDGSTEALEGNYYETENEYDIYIYYHPQGARYDRLIGVGNIK